MKSLLLVLLLSAAYGAGQTTPGRTDGKWLLRNCNALLRVADNEPAASGSWCLGYLAGFIDGLDIGAIVTSKDYSEYKPFHSTQLCFPAGNTIEQNARVLVHWLNEHPERLL